MEFNAMKGTAAGGVVHLSRSETVRRPESVDPSAAAAEDVQQQPVTVQSPQRQPVEAAISSIQEFAQSIQRNLNFALDESSGRVVVKVTDGVSGEVIRQIPSEEALRLAESLDEVRSLLFKAEA